MNEFSRIGNDSFTEPFPRLPELVATAQTRHHSTVYSCSSAVYSCSSERVFDLERDDVMMRYPDGRWKMEGVV